MRFILSFIFVSLCLLSVDAQDFHRNYKLQSDEENECMSGIQLGNMDFASLSAVSLDTAYRNAYITFYDKKGTILSSQTKQLFFHGLDTLSQLELGTGDLIQTSNGNLVYGLTTKRTDRPNKIVGAVSARGTYLWSKAITDSGLEEQTVVRSSLLSNYLDSTFIHASAINTVENPINTLSSLSQDGDVIFVKRQNSSLNGTTINTYIDGVNFSEEDSLILVSGSYQDSNAYILNAFQHDLSSKFATYTVDTLDSLKVYHTHAAHATVDSGYVVVGHISSLSDSTYHQGFIAKHDSLGSVLWAKAINLGNDENNNVYDVVINSNNDIVLALASNVENEDSSAAFIVLLDDDGTYMWDKMYDRASMVLNKMGSFTRSTSEGYVLFNTSTREDLDRTSLIKTNTSGETTCEIEFNKDMLTDLSLASFTYITELVDDTSLGYDDVLMRADAFNSFDVPTLSLSANRFCPNEQIIDTLVATVDGAVSYLWSDGSTNDSLIIFDDQEYTVIVTIEDEVCYTLCDTVAADRYTLPTAGLSYQCDNGSYVLNANYLPGKGLDTIIWSTGEVGSPFSITVDEKATYAVTIVDECMEEATAEVSINNPDPTFDVEWTGCSGDEFFYEIVAPGTEILDVMWSTGEDDRGKTSITVNQSGDYSVTLTDICNESSTKNFNVPELPTEVNITPNFDTNCNGSPFSLTASIDGITRGIEWNTGEDTLTIFKFSPGEYTITVTDLCDNEITESIIVTQEDLPVDAESVSIISNSSNICDNNKITLTASVVGPYHSLEWSTGETTDTISVTANGQEITVTVFDDCGNINATVIASPKGNALRFPNLFFPDRPSYEHPENIEFGGYISSTTENNMGQIDTILGDYSKILNFELRVFNRWGQEVFSSNDVNERWNGSDEDSTNRNNTQLPEVYVWFAKWEDEEGCVFERKGDLTVMR